MITLGGTPPAGGGGGGPGTVTQVASQSNSLLNSSLPNPIVVAGTIQFEVQIISATYVAVALLELGGALLEGVIYRISNFNHAIGGGKTLVTADFMTEKNNAGATVLSTRGVAYSATARYELSYDLQNDFILELYCPKYDERARRSLTSGSNNIDNLQWEVDLGFDDDESFFAGVTTGLISVTKSVTKACTIDFQGTQSQIQNVFAIKSQINFTRDTVLRNGTAKANSRLDIGEVTENFTVEEHGTIFVPVGFAYSGLRVGTGGQVVLSSSQQNKVYEGAMNELQRFAPVDGGTDTIVDSVATHIFVHLHPDSVPPVLSYTLKLPLTPLDGQVFHIGSDEAMAGVVIDGNGKTVDSSVAVFSKNQCIAYFYDLITDFYYLV